MAIYSEVGKPTGICNLKEGLAKFQLSRFHPAPDLAPFVAHYWLVEWNLRGQPPYLSETLPHPSVHWVIDQDSADIVGIMTGKFTRRLEGKGRVFGIKLRPGAFYPFVKTPVSTFTDRTVPMRELFGSDAETYESAVRAADDAGRMIVAATGLVRAWLPPRDENVERVNAIIDCIRTERTITRVEDVVKHAHLSKRSLQRVFQQYVGVPPKWVIQRYRLHEAVEQLDAGNEVDLPMLAQRLGYFDQAHFIKDFKGLVGKTPGAYARP